MSELKIGLIADTSIQLSNLESIVTSAEYEVAEKLITRYDELESLPSVGIWVVRIDMEDERSQALIEYLDSLDLPVIYDEADSYSSLNIEERARRFSKKIEACGFGSENQNYKSHDLTRAKYVWVLAASAGGPEAVLSFIKSVPPELEGVAFVYVQHMDENMAPPLVKSLKRNTDWQVFYCDRAWNIFEKSIYVISASFQADINEIGMLSPDTAPWAGPYKPSVDHVVAKVWRKFGKDSGVIVFSGMGNDGAKTCRMIKNAGGQVWVQSPDSCAVDSMPSEVIRTQCVSFTGTPEQLALHFSVCHRKLNQMALDTDNDSHNSNKERNAL